MLLQKGVRKMIEPVCILMSNHSTQEMFSNLWMVQNIFHTRGRYTTIHCNYQKRCITKEATLKGYGLVWFDEGTIANIIYFSGIWD